MAEKSFAEVFVSQNSGEARLIREMLRSEGLDAVILDEYASGSVAGFGPAIPVRVVVPAAQADAAKTLIKEAEQ